MSPFQGEGHGFKSRPPLIMKKVFLLILFSYFIYFILTPPLHTPDEPEHYENTFWLSQFRYPFQPIKIKKPKLFVDQLNQLYLKKPLDFDQIKKTPLRKKIFYSEKDLKKFDQVTLQSYHPPFYYFLISFSHHLSNWLKVDLISRFYLARLFSSFFYFGMIYFVYKILMIVFKNKIIASSLLLFFSLNPTVIKTGIGINPDLGTAFFSYFLLLLVLKLSEEKVLKIKSVVYLAIISAASSLSKLSGVFTGLFFIFYGLIKEKLSKKLLFKFFLFYFLFFILISPWFYLNLRRYRTLKTSAFYLAEPKKIYPRPFFSSLFSAAFEFRHTIMHYAGFLGRQNEISPPKLVFVFYTIASSLLAFKGFLRIIKKRRMKIVIFYLLSNIFILYLLSFYFKKQGFFWDIQGRYFLSGFLPFSILIYFGFPSKIFFTFFSIIYYYYILFFVFIPSYYKLQNLNWQLNSLYPGFGFLFFLIFPFHLVLSFLIIRRLLKPNSK